MWEGGTRGWRRSWGKGERVAERYKAEDEEHKKKDRKSVV